MAGIFVALTVILTNVILNRRFLNRVRAHLDIYLSQPRIYLDGVSMEQKTGANSNKRSSDKQNGDEFSRNWTGKIGTKRQAYYIYVDLIAKLRGYAYWERRKISETVNCALEQFFEGKEVKPRPPGKTLSNSNKRSSDKQNGDEFSRNWTGKIGTKRQTYYIYVDLIAKLRGYAYWERRKISETVNCALEQFFEGKEVKPRPPGKTL